MLATRLSGTSYSTRRWVFTSWGLNDNCQPPSAPWITCRPRRMAARARKRGARGHDGDHQPVAIAGLAHHWLGVRERTLHQLMPPGCEDSAVKRLHLPQPDRKPTQPARQPGEIRIGLQDTQGGSQLPEAGVDGVVGVRPRPKRLGKK